MSVQTLETRRLLSAVTAFDSESGSLQVHSGSGGDLALSVSVDGSVLINGQEPSGPPIVAQDVWSLTVLGSDAPDRIDVSQVKRRDFPDLAGVLVEGADGRDTLIGSPLDDTLHGGLGNDRVLAGAGHDRIHAGAGRDTVFGGSGRDTIHGGTGRDRLLGRTGADQISGDGGNDFLDGGRQDDVLAGGNGHDTLIGGGESDRLDGGVGRDLLKSESRPTVTTVRVTTLNPDGPGSLSEAVSQGNRRIHFDVAGIIDLRTATEQRPDYELVIRTSNLVIDGSTAPGSGITIIGARVRLDGVSNVTLRHIRIRTGDDQRGPIDDEDRDSLRIDASENVLIQNVSLSWSRDEMADIWDGSKNITFDRVLISEGLDANRHGHGFLAGKCSTEVTLTRSLIANIRKRAPKFGFAPSHHERSSGLVVNNVIYNPLGRTMIAGNQSHMAAIGNIVIPGPDTRDSIALLETQPGVSAGTSVYLEDNYFDAADMVMAPHPDRSTPLFTSPATIDNREAYDWNVSYRQGVTNLRGALSPTDHDSRVDVIPDAWMNEQLASMAVLPVDTVLETVLMEVGAFPRDAIDARVVAGVRNRTGRVIQSQDDVEGFPEPVSHPPGIPIPVRLEDDTLLGGPGRDTLIGGAGNDVLNGQAGADFLTGQNGDDILQGGSGPDTLHGESGADRLVGQSGSDITHGGPGDDLAIWRARDGADSHFGDQGSDRLLVRGTPNDDSIALNGTDRALHVTVALEQFTATRFEAAEIRAGAGNDVLATGNLEGIVSNYPNSDGFLLTLRGESGNDTLDVSAITDAFVTARLNGGAGMDALLRETL